MTPEQIAELLTLSQVLRELRHSEPWKALVNQLKTVEALLTEQLIQAPMEDHDTLRGEIQGIRRAINYPDNVIRAADQVRQAPGEPAAQ